MESLLRSVAEPQFLGLGHKLAHGLLALGVNLFLVGFQILKPDPTVRPDLVKPYGVFFKQADKVWARHIQVIRSLLRREFRMNRYQGNGVTMGHFNQQVLEQTSGSDRQRQHPPIVQLHPKRMIRSPQRQNTTRIPPPNERLPRLARQFPPSRSTRPYQFLLHRSYEYMYFPECKRNNRNAFGAPVREEGDSFWHRSKGCMLSFAMIADALSCL